MTFMVQVFLKRILKCGINRTATKILLLIAVPLVTFEVFAEPDEDSLPAGTVNSVPENDYTNYAKKGSYENETWFSEVPEWHYYDMFGNKLLDGYYLYGLTMDRNSIGTGASHVALHPFLKKWLNGLVQVADLEENGGILAMIGDRVKSEFTPFSFKQTLFAGARFDVFYKENSVTFLTNRISSTGTYGMVTDWSTSTDSSDWLTGAHVARKFGELADVGGTFVNIHHEEGKNSSNPFSGTDGDALHTKSPTGLSLFGVDAKLNLEKIQGYGEYLRSQEYLDGRVSPKAGNVATFNGYYDLLDQLRCGGEMYTIGSRFTSNFSCPSHPEGDGFYTGKYQYSLIEDNDDHDDYPENGKTKYPYFPVGDPDGTIPAGFDKDKNGVWDFEQNFLSYDADPPDSRILFDRNSNGIPDEVEDDPYPDYPYIPSYYLPGERYWRYDDVDQKWENKFADSLTHKGLAGIHLYGKYEVIPDLKVTLGGIYDRSQEKSFHPVYENGLEITEEYTLEQALSLYLMARYRKDVGRDRSIVIEDLCRKVTDNIPNHTQGFLIDSEVVKYSLTPDELDYRDAFSNALRAEFNIFRNRGFNYTASAKYEFQKHFAHLKYNYPDANISSFSLINKCQYIYLLPFLKDLFLIPKFKNVYEAEGYGATNELLGDKYQRNAMTNAAYLVLEWRITEKSAITTGFQAQQFNDFSDAGENYFQPCFSIQLMVKDRYTGLAMVLTTGLSQYAYYYEQPGRRHDPMNNPYRVTDNIKAHELFIRIHCGF
jgi:hypothetical protein